MGNNQYEIASMLQITRQMGKSPELDRLQYIKTESGNILLYFWNDG